VDIAFLNLVGADFSGDHPAHILQFDLKILGMGDVLEGAGEQLGFGITDQIAECAVDFEPPAVGRYQSHADGRILERTGEAFLTFPQCVFRPLALRDVLNHSLKLPRVAFLLKQTPDPVLMPNRQIVRRMQAIVERNHRLIRWQ
jgi:hypothetical protein